MRIILILIVVAAIFAVVQSKRHNCTWGEPGWFDCVLGKTATGTPASSEAPAMPEPAAPPASNP